MKKKTLKRKIKELEARIAVLECAPPYYFQPYLPYWEISTPWYKTTTNAPFVTIYETSAGAQIVEN